MESVAKAARQAKFWKKFMRLTRGRISVLRALEIAGEEEQDPSFRNLILSLKKKMDDGALLSDAVAESPEEFSLSTVEMIRSAEKTGAWDEILEELAGGLLDGTFS